MCHPKGYVGFLRRFGLKTGILMSKKEREICEFEMDLNNVFVCGLI